jgi:hypothetical protein
LLGGNWQESELAHGYSAALSHIKVLPFGGMMRTELQRLLNAAADNACWTGSRWNKSFECCCFAVLAMYLQVSSPSCGV